LLQTYVSLEMQAPTSAHNVIRAPFKSPFAFLFLLFCCVQNVNAQGFQWAKSFGGAATDAIVTMVADNSGNVYAISKVESSVNFGSGAISTHGSRDALVTKYNSAGTLVWYTLVGGSSSDDGNGITFDSTGNIYITGSFIGTMICAQDTLVSNGGMDIYVVKLNASGTVLWGRSAGATGTGTDYGTNIAYCYQDNSVVFTGHITGNCTFGSHPITTVNPSDAFLTKVDGNGTWLWVQDIGTSGSDYGSHVAIDGSNNIYMTGSIASDGFLKKFDSSGSILWTLNALSVASSLAGGVVIDNNGDIYFSGDCDDAVTVGTITVPAPGGQGGYLFKVSPSGNTIWGRGMEGYILYTADLATDNNGNVFISGSFKNTFYTDTTIFLDIYSADYESYVAKYDPAGNLIWMKQLGTVSVDMGYAVAVGGGSVYVGGYAMGAPNPTMGSTVFTLYGGPDAFIAKFSDCMPPFTQVTPGFYVYSCAGTPVQLQSTTTSSSYTYQWQSNGFPMSSTNPTLTIAGNPGNSGSYAVTITSAGCTYTSHYVGVFIYPLPVVNFTTVQYGPSCNRDSVRISADNLLQHTYQWLYNGIPIPGAIGLNYTADTTGDYSVIVTSPFGCSDTSDAGIIYAGHYPNLTAYSSDTVICAGQTITLNASGAASYSWTPTINVVHPTFASTNATPASTITYTVIGTAAGCTDTAYINVLVNPLPQPVVTYNGYLLFCNTYNSYQWYCNNSIIPGATYQVINPPLNGNYKVKVTDSSGCSNFSNVVNVINSGIADADGNVGLNIFPQPLIETTTISLPEYIQHGELELYSVSGELVFKSGIENASSVILYRNQLPAGLFFVKIVSEKAVFTSKILIQ
jgi:hypothetical protein